MDKQKVIDAIELAGIAINECSKAENGTLDWENISANISSLAVVNLAGNILVADALKELKPVPPNIMGYPQYVIGVDMAKDFTGGYAEELAKGKKDDK